MSLLLPLSELKGVGPKRADQLAGKGLRTIHDLLYFLPTGYEDRSRLLTLKQAEDDTTILVKGKVLFGREERFYPSRKRLFKIVIQDDDMKLELIWFNYRKPHLNQYTKPGLEIIVYGTIKNNRGTRQMFHPDVTIQNNKESVEPLGFFPLYSAVGKISNSFLRSLMKTVLDNHINQLNDPLPRSLTKRIGMPELSLAIKQVHFPNKELSMDLLKESQTIYHKRLIFDRFFTMMLAVIYKKKSRENISVPVLDIPKRFPGSFQNYFPFTFTDDQIEAVKEIAQDFKMGRPMNRLLMGDVGTGKTLVATSAAFLVIHNNQQVALMVPTQVLAEQHMDYFVNLPKEMGFRPVLLTGEMKKNDRVNIYKKIETGQHNLIIGTHALIQDKLVFNDLGLAIIDEQQRFGVRQRALMEKKGKTTPHIIVMSATPIPRTLAVTLYGDMDISIIKQYPDKRVPVVTHLVKRSKKRWVFGKLKQRLSQEKQAYVICPIIEESEESHLKSVEEMADQLKKILSPTFKIGVIHGHMDSVEKEKTITSFKNKEIDILVGTTVIEVGIHVPNATLMIIEHPECFGLAQLHQLRGRIGRDGKGGDCILMLPESLSENSIARLREIVSCNDGFEIAQKDLELRGHGEMTGTRQSGFRELDLDEIIRESELFEKAREEARNLIEEDPELIRHENLQLKTLMEELSESHVNL